MSTINALIGVLLTPLPLFGAGKKEESTCSGAPTLAANMDGEDSNWHKADARTNGGFFNTGWRADHAFFNNGYLNLQVDDQSCPRGCSGKPYASGEYRTNRHYGYGFYEVRFKAAKGDGLVSSFFTYTGPSENNPHDEIDIEILGKNPRQMQINYFTGGTGKHEAMIDLGFDASEDFHNYAISWSKDSIAWFVDGKKIHTETGSRGPLPTHPGRIMVNLWPGIGVDGWLKPFRYSGPVRAQYDWIKYTPANACLPAEVEPEEVKPPTPYLSGRADPALGEESADGRLKLDSSKLEDLFKKKELTRDQLKKMLQAIVYRPSGAALDPAFSFDNQTDLFHHYPELKAIHEIDFRFDWYFIDSREYWGNAIILLSLYVQKCMEDNHLKDLPEALEMVNKIRDRLLIQREVDAATNLPRMPYDYSLALLDITEAEIRAQSKNQPDEFYTQGIQLALQGLKELFSIENKGVFPFKPDYFTVTKTLLILGDLYQQLAHLTLDEAQREKYFRVSYQLYQAVAGLDESGTRSLFLSLDWLVADPLLSRSDQVNLSLPRPTPLGMEMVIDPSTVDNALAFNYARGAIRVGDAIKANVGIFHYLPGVALIKQAGLFGAWPMQRPKSVAELLAQIENVEKGLTEINGAVRKTGEDEQKIAFFSYLGEMVEGELLMALADRINFYQDIPAKETWNQLQKQPRVFSIIRKGLQDNINKAWSEKSWKKLEGDRKSTEYLPTSFEQLRKDAKENPAKLEKFAKELLQAKEWTREEAAAKKVASLYHWAILIWNEKAIPNKREQAELLIATAGNYHFSNLPLKFDYLSAWSKVNLLEIMLRNANYVIWDYVGGERMKVGDPVREIAFLDQTEPLLEAAFWGSQKAEYLKIKFDYIHATLRLTGLPQKDKRGKYIPTYDSTDNKGVKTIFFQDEVLSLVENIENNLPTQPAAPQTYFGIYGRLKEVGVLLQCRDRTREQNQRVLQRITRDPAILDYLAKRIEPKKISAKDSIEVIRSKLKENILTKMGKGELEKVLLYYALYLLEKIEKRVAPPLPPYLEYNLGQTLRQRIEKRRFHEVGKEMAPTKHFVNTVIVKHYPGSANEILGKMALLEKALHRGKVQESIKALNDFINAIKQLDNSASFASKYGELLAWDLHSLRAELYHQTAMIYSILEKNSEAIIMHQYVQSAYLECALSSSNYDIKHRPFLIKRLRDFPDKKVPQLKRLEERLNIKK